MINVGVPWPPSVNHYYTVSRGRKILSKKGREYKKEAAALLCEQGAPRDLEGRLEVSIDAYPPDRRPRDVDNLLKPILDALQDYGMFNDSQIDDLRIRRMDVGGCIRVRIGTI